MPAPRSIPRSINVLASLIGEHRDSDPVRACIRSDSLTLTVEPDLEEGEPERAFLESNRFGYALACSDGNVDTVYFYIEPRDGFARFRGELARGLASTSAPSEVRGAFGAPERSGDPQPAGLLGPSGAWDRFVWNGLRIHFQYTLDGTGISLITVMSAEVAP